MATKHNAVFVKYDAISEREKSQLNHDNVAAKYGVPPSTLSTWFIKAGITGVHIGISNIDVISQKDCTAMYPELDDALITWRRL